MRTERVREVIAAAPPLDKVEALDVNPVLVRPEGCVAVDAFVKPAAGSCAAGASQAA